MESVNKQKQQNEGEKKYVHNKGVKLKTYRHCCR